jgi:inorganic pyrophosphatase
MAKKKLLTTIPVVYPKSKKKETEHLKKSARRITLQFRKYNDLGVYDLKRKNSNATIHIKGIQDVKEAQMLIAKALCNVKGLVVTYA